MSRGVTLKDADLAIGRKMPNLIELVNAHWAMDCYHCSQVRSEAQAPFPQYSKSTV